MKAIFIGVVAPFPKSVGKTVVTGGICDFLSDAEEVSAWRLLCFEPVDSKYRLDVTTLPKPSSVGKIINTLWHSFFLQRKSIQESFFWSGRARRVIRQAIIDFQPDVVIYDTLRAGQFLTHIPNCPIKQIIYLDDLFSVRYGRLLHAMRQHQLAEINPLGNFGNNIPRLLLRVYDRFKWVHALLLRLEQRLVARSERSAPARFDRCLLVSQAEVDVLRPQTGADNIRALPPRIGSAESVVKRTWSGRPEFVFLGALSLSHNAFGIECFIEEILPKAIKAIPGVRILVVGRQPSGRLQALAGKFSEHVRLLGFVDDLDPLLADCCGMLSPLLFGSGIKLKVIDALRCGAPLITTEIGVEGIDVANVDGVRVVAQLSQFPDAMARLLDHRVNKAASESNRQAFVERYSTSIVDGIYREYFFEKKRN